MMMTFSADRVNEFKTAYLTPLGTWQGKRPAAWADRIEPGLAKSLNLTDTPLTRTTLKNLWRDRNVTVEACVMATMAWGGMRADHGRRLWQRRADWVNVCSDIRSLKYSRAEAYRSLQELSRNKQLPGAGPAYFTKILHFAMPDSALIMDQWAVRSLHYLSSQGDWPRVAKDYSSAKKAQSVSGALRVTVSHHNDHSVYEGYCVAIERLTEMLNISDASLVEERLFSKGGRAAHPWRKKIMFSWKTERSPFYM